MQLNLTFSVPLLHLPSIRLAPKKSYISFLKLESIEFPSSINSLLIFREPLGEFPANVSWVNEKLGWLALVYFFISKVGSEGQSPMCPSSTPHPFIHHLSSHLPIQAGVMQSVSGKAMKIVKLERNSPKQQIPEDFYLLYPFVLTSS